MNHTVSSAVYDYNCHYRYLEDGELIVAGDEWLDNTGWLPTICVGEKAPNPIFPAHRVYRRRIVVGGD